MSVLTTENGKEITEGHLHAFRSILDTLKPIPFYCGAGLVIGVIVGSVFSHYLLAAAGRPLQAICVIGFTIVGFFLLRAYVEQNFKKAVAEARKQYDFAHHDVQTILVRLGGEEGYSAVSQKAITLLNHPWN